MEGVAAGIVIPGRSWRAPAAWVATRPTPLLVEALSVEASECGQWT
jgi:hypothetical protein